MHQHDVPSASTEESLPGFSIPQSLRSLARVIGHLISSLSINKMVFILLILAATNKGAEGCAPSFFTREQRNAPEGQPYGDRLVASAIETNSIEDPVLSVQPEGSGTTPPISESSLVNPKFRGNLNGYGPKKSKKDRKRRCHDEHPVCHNGGTCYMQFSSGEMRTFCECSSLYAGARCEIPIDRNVMASAINGNTVQTSAAYSALSFFLIMVMVTIAVAIYGYRRMAQQHCEESVDEEGWTSSRRISFTDMARNKHNTNTTSSTSPSAIVDSLPDSYYRKHSMIHSPGNLIRLPGVNVDHELRSTPTHTRKLTITCPHTIRREGFVDQTRSTSTLPTLKIDQS